MKIVQFIASSGWGGAEKIFVLLANTLAKTHIVTVITYDNPVIVSGLDSSIRCIIMPKKSRNNLIVYRKLYRVLSRESFDLAHTHGAKASEIIYQIRRFLLLPQVATKHNSRKGVIFEKVENTISVSLDSANSIHQKTTMIHNGILASPIVLKDEAHTPFRMIALGRLDPIKGFDHLIQQTSQLNINFELKIIGDGPQKKKLQQQVARLGLKNKITLTGYKTNIPELMSQSDLVIVSSLSEGFSLVTAESLFYAKVLLSTKVGISVEILDDHLLTDHNHIAEKITAIASNYAWHRQHFKAIQKQNRNKFMIENVAKSYERVYEQVCRKTTRQRSP